MLPEELFSNNQKLVYSIYWKYFSGKVPECWQQDIIQEGLLGLWKACKSFNESLGYSFSTYAFPFAKGYMQRFYREEISCIKIPRKMWEDGNINFSIISLDEPINDIDDTITLKDIIAADSYLDEGEAFTIDLLESFLSTIANNRHRHIVEEYFYGKLFFEAPKQIELSKKYGVSQSQITRILQRYRKKFAEFITNESG